MKIGSLPTLRSARLVLAPLVGESLAAWLRADRDELRRELGLVFPDVPGDPPMLGVDLLELRASSDPDRLHGWWIWISALRELGVAVGTLAVEGGDDHDGSIRVAHWTYPQWEGRAFAREASDAIAAWILDASEGDRPIVPPPPRSTGSTGTPLHSGPEDHPRIGDCFVYEPRPRNRT